jgi:hypothetical protein
MWQENTKSTTVCYIIFKRSNSTCYGVVNCIYKNIKSKINISEVDLCVYVQRVFKKNIYIYGKSILHKLTYVCMYSVYLKLMNGIKMKLAYKFECIRVNVCSELEHVYKYKFIVSIKGKIIKSYR